jgi:L-seryl-tRNA(Ser) seleniumtransferase
MLQYATMPKRKTAIVQGVRSGAPTESALRQIPSLDELLKRRRLAALANEVSRSSLVEIARRVIGEFRETLLRRERTTTGTADALWDAEHIEELVVAEVARLLRPSLVPVINATGVILHTNLGRAPLAAAAISRNREVATQYSNLEYDLTRGARGKRDVHTSPLLTYVTGAEAAIVVNNNAAAVYLVLAALARGGEVIVSRGELIEIGDGFRIPDIMAESGAALREVGTTNRTRLSDYECAISDRTRLLLRVHRSNFRVVGFTKQPSLDQLAALGKRAGVPVYEDLGSGCLLDMSGQEIEEPIVRASFAAGVSVVSFSGDKLLGGPQCGVIAGSRELIARIRQHPMFRALRVDKLTIGALETTLALYLRGGPESQIPVVRMIQTNYGELSKRAETILAQLRQKIPLAAAELDLRDTHSVIGGGSTPGLLLKTRAIILKSSKHSASRLEERLRRSSPLPVIARVEEHHVWIDLRTVFQEQESSLVDAIATALK